MRTDFDWYDGTCIPDKPYYCLCKVKGIPYTKYMTLKWDGKYWWMWNYFNNETMGWYGIFPHSKIVRWCLIEKADNEDNN